MDKLPKTIATGDEAGKNCHNYCGGEFCSTTFLTIGSFSAGSGFTREEAAEIVKRWNSHDLMLEVLKSIENDDGRIPANIWNKRNEAIAAAQNEAGLHSLRRPTAGFWSHEGFVIYNGWGDLMFARTADELNATDIDEIEETCKQELKTFCKVDNEIGKWTAKKDNWRVRTGIARYNEDK